jgi:L,D-transpeptidase catalytic domain
MRGRRVVVVAGRAAVLLAVVVVIPACAPSRPRVRAVAIPLARSDWPRPEVLDAAMRAWECGRQEGDFDSGLLTVVDYSLPSTERRLWVIDVPTHRVVNHEFVAHGRGSGENQAVSFSNQPGSLQSSLGLFRTEDTYFGGEGYSLRLRGLEPGVNDRAMERRIVVHGADYVNPTMIAEHGRLGRSWGCLALSRDVASTVIDRIKGGSAVFAYYPDPDWMQTSQFLRCDGSRLARR